MSGALVAVSGGVDSSVAALLARDSGLDCVCATMKLFVDDGGYNREKTCCSFADASDARNVANKLGLDFFVFNFANTFKERVTDKFIRAYENGETPNPCIDCNRFIKFERLLARAKELDKDCIVTGHYARVEKIGGRFVLKKGVDSSKDQSYVLYAMTQEQLARAVFPLGGLRKTQVREIALRNGFINAEKRDSQDICFAQGGDYAGFIERNTGREYPRGRFTDANGAVLGEHKGIIRYTVGQRKGLGLSCGEPLYVCAINSESNTVTLGKERDLYAKTLFADDINLIAADGFSAPINVMAKIRYKQPEQRARVWQTGQGTLRVEFDSPQRAVTKGQAVVLYDGDTVIGGGTIRGSAR